LVLQALSPCAQEEKKIMDIVKQESMAKCKPEIADFAQSLSPLLPAQTLNPKT
jgi:hypothetical protein